MSNFTKKYKAEISIFSLAMLFAFIGDIIGGVKGAEYSFVVGLLGQASTFFFSVFTIVVLYKLLMGFFTGDKFHDMIRKIPCPEAEPKTKTPRAKTTSRTK